MELADLPDFGPGDNALIEDGEVDPYGTDSLGIAWREKSGHVGMMEAGRLIAHAGWVAVRVRAAGGAVEAVGLGGVLVHRDHRGRGVGGELVTGAMNRMGSLGSPIGLLFCRTQRVPFYRRLGWEVFGHGVTADQPSGRVTMPLVTCWTGFVDGASPPASELQIEGLPF
ncbi:MAG TPA: GNAT family N-acetyltransferase [Acidimicrobiales bacterium]|nr:GNAT family N-acetyltransferase [Acidimicrobiales bacterium]